MTKGAGIRARVAARVGTRDIDVDVDSGPGILVLVGPNGAGKSSFLALLLGALRPERGRIAVGTEVLLDTSAGVDVPVERRRLGYLPQDYGLLPHLSVRGNIEFAIGSASPRPAPDDGARHASRVMGDLGLDALADRAIATLSGGEKQRVGLARALAVGPRALLLDEPLAALDTHARRDVRTFLGRYLRALALPTIVITHDRADAMALGDRVAVLERGALTQIGSWEDLVAAPRTRFVEEFVGGTSPR